MFRDFGIFGMSSLKDEANAVLVIDPDAVLAFPVAAQCFQAVARRDQQIGDGLSGVQRSQTAQGHGLDMSELFDALPAKKALGLLASEAPNH